MRIMSVITSCALVLSFFACKTLRAKARVIEQTEATAVIEGVGPTEYEAKKNALAQGQEMFQEVTESKPAECTQGYRSSGHTSGVSGNKSYSASGRTFFSCVVFVSKK